MWKNYNKTANNFDIFKRTRNLELQSSKKKWAFINYTLQQENQSSSIKTLSYGGKFHMSDPKDISRHLNKTFVMMGMYNGPEIHYLTSSPKSRSRFQLSFATSDDGNKTQGNTKT